MSRTMIKTVLVSIMVVTMLTGCALLSLSQKTDARWSNFKSWTKVTAGIEPTGDFSGDLSQIHEGAEGYRDVYVNDIAKDTMLGEPPYLFPEGSVIVKHQFENKQDWEAGESGDVRVSIKSKDDGTRSADNWLWVVGLRGRATSSSFCSSCHEAATTDYNSDYVFSTAEFLKRRSLLTNIKPAFKTSAFAHQ